MKLGVKVDVSKFNEAMESVRTSKNSMVFVEMAGAQVLINGQRTLVPVDTAATKASIMSHYATKSAKLIVDEVGPETDYAPAIEYGRADLPNYPMQPFIRPAARQGFTKVIRAMSMRFAKLIIDSIENSKENVL